MSVSTRPQRGIALLVALLVVALATVLIAGLLDRGELAVARTRNLLRAAQAEAYAAGLENYAAHVLSKDQRETGRNDTNGDIWAIPLPQTPVPGGGISATMRDMNGCFNLNNLVQNGQPRADWIVLFGRLLNALKLDAALTNPVVDWLDPDLNASDSGGAEDPYYLALPVPYRTANRQFTHVSELRLVKGVSADVYRTLAPQVCALPPGTLINLNTASIPVLMALAPEVTKELAQRLWSDGHAHFQSTADVFRTLAQQHVLVDAGVQHDFSVESHYFLARGDIVLDELPFTFFSLIERGPQGIRVLARSRGADE